MNVRIRQHFGFALLAVLACSDAGQAGRPQVTDTGDVLDSASETTGSPEPDASSEPIAAKPEPEVQRTPKMCPHAFEPSLAPVERPELQPNNSAMRVQSLRGRLERVDVIEPSTHRVLFSVDEEVVNALRRTPAHPPIAWEPDMRPASLPAWRVALLFYVAGKPRPYLGWFFDDDQVYFVDEADPWDFAVFEADGEKPRDVYSIPTNLELSYFLTDRLGEYDPFDKLAHEAQRLEDARCGRVSRPHGDPFPDLPRARIESAAP